MMEWFFWILMWLTLGCAGYMFGVVVNACFYKKEIPSPLLPVLIGPISILMACKALWWWIQNYRKDKK